MATLLVVDDEPSICWGLQKVGEGLGHEVLTAASAEAALELLDDARPDAVVLDIRLPGIDGLTAIDPFRQRIGNVPMIVITAYGDLETAVKAVREGAFEYIVKPFDLEVVQRALMRALASGALPNAAAKTPPRDHVGGLVGQSPAMQRAFNQIALAAASEASVLLCGESGTGKELAARAIHQYSQRSGGPFVAVNVAALSSSLAESELFGHTRGAFTGADQDRVGLLVQADHGTLFLDEVADIPLSAQVKLLRALEHGEVAPVGSSKSTPTDFRVVCATHQDLAAKVKRGDFRHDLYFRLGAFRIEMPALRDRDGDIRRLAEYFLQRIVGPGEAVPRISDAAFAELERRPWHGNVRELRNAIEHALIVARGGLVEPDHFAPPAAASHDAGALSIDETIAALVAQWTHAQLAGDADAPDLYEQLLRLVEPPLLRAALEKHRGQCSSAARQLGLHRTTLRKKLDQYDISAD